MRWTKPPPARRILWSDADAARGGSGALLDELERLLPGVLGRVGELLVLSVEEAVRGARVRDELVFDSRSRERRLEGGIVLGRDVRVVARLEGEDRPRHLPRPLDRPGRAIGAFSGAPVEANRSGEPMAARRGEPGVAAAHAEADGEDGGTALSAQPGDARADVRLDLGRRDDPDVLHVVEVVVALRHARRPAEVVEGNGGIAALGEAECELLVEAVEPTHVRQDHDAGRRPFVGKCTERGELVAVRSLEHELVVRDGRARDNGDRRQRVEVEAHGSKTIAAFYRRPLGDPADARPPSACDTECERRRHETNPRHVRDEEGLDERGGRGGGAATRGPWPLDDAASGRRGRRARRLRRRGRRRRALHG